VILLDLGGRYFWVVRTTLQTLLIYMKLSRPGSRGLQGACLEIQRNLDAKTERRMTRRSSPFQVHQVRVRVVFLSLSDEACVVHLTLVSFFLLVSFRSLRKGTHSTEYLDKELEARILRTALYGVNGHNSVPTLRSQELTCTF
jgi:hypothetical protein